MAVVVQNKKCRAWLIFSGRITSRLLLLYCYYWRPGLRSRKILLCSMVIIAGVRLGTHLAVRVLKHLHDEEPRYAQIRKEWGANAEAKMAGFFQMQAASNVLLAIPFFISVMNTSTELSPFEYVGAVLWLISVIGEATADAATGRILKRIRRTKVKFAIPVCGVIQGTPTTFFEWLMWVSYFVFALGSPYGYLAIISPAIILYLLTKVTGIPATEQQSLAVKRRSI